MRTMLPALLFTLLLTTAATALAAAGGNLTLQGKITSLAGEPVADAEVYLYASRNTRRPADFISPKSSSTGSYRMVLPAGDYWAIARVKKGERFGPLMPGDRHSGEPVKVAPEGEAELTVDFTVADMQEYAQRREKGREELVEITGSLTGADGKALADAYAYARTGRLAATLPDHFSAWTDENGRYRLKLPPGRYYLGSAREFPPPAGSPPLQEIDLTGGKLPVAIDLQIPVE